MHWAGAGPAHGTRTLVVGRQDYVVRALDTLTGGERWNVSWGRAALLQAPASASAAQLQEEAAAQLQEAATQLTPHTEPAARGVHPSCSRVRQRWCCMHMAAGAAAMCSDTWLGDPGAADCG